ncbi:MULTISPECIES: DUF4239 domain-containing protein [unclassified Kitasatospora]|uniref:bestrophin-like domain n=1 Tax=unclassified Kitasatospora TaxID=2633591 RepID=UPI0035E1C981
MELWLLNHLSTAWLGVLVVGGSVLLALAGSVLVSRWSPTLARGGNNDMVGVVLGIFGAIYGLILAFVIVNLWTELQDTQKVVSAEATAVSQIARDAAAFPPGPRAAVTASVGDYVHVVVERQWPLMRAGRGEFTATGTEVDAMYRALLAFEPQSPSEQAFYAKALDSLNDVAGRRRDRINASGSELPVLLQVLIVGGAVAIVLLSLLYGVRARRARLLFVGSVAALIGFSLLLVLVLDRPFAGELCISPEPFRQSALARFW